MQHLAPLIYDLAIILMTAAVTSLIFKKLKQPVILGYMVAGLLIGPQTHFFPNIIEVDTIKVWAEMGVIFMLFALGIEFSFRKVLLLGPSILLVGVFEVLAMSVLGFCVAQIWGWSLLPSLFLGASVSISSTAIIFKAFEEFEVKGKKFAQVVFGVLIMEDLLAVLFLVLLTTLALTKQFEGLEILFVSAKLFFYLALWLVVGLFVVPWALRLAKPLLSDETLLVVSLGLCLMMVVAANQVGFSAALGAFVMGSILGESEEKEKIEQLLLPVKNLFSAVFFVSVGMLIHPQTLLEQPAMILGLTALVIFGKVFFATTGALLAGVPGRTAIPVGLSLAQIGEFSFIMATLGITTHILNDSFYSSIVAVSAITAFTTPFLIRSREKVTPWIQALIPQKIQTTFNDYLNLSTLASVNPTLRKWFRGYIWKIAINAVVVIAIFIFTSNLLYPWAQLHLSDRPAQFVTLFLTLLLASPFFWALIFSHPRRGAVLSFDQSTWQLKPLQQIFLMFRMALAFVLLSVLVAQFLSLKYAVFLSLVLFLLITFILFNHLGPLYLWFESHFIKQLQPSTPVAPTATAPVLAPWDAHLSVYEIPPEADFIGDTLMSLSLKEKFGIIIAMIHRGGRRITAPARTDRLMPHDRVTVIGTDEQLSKFEDYLRAHLQKPSPVLINEHYTLERYFVTSESPFLNKVIRDSGIRERTEGLIVGIERRQEKILNPDSGLIIELNDLLWIVGDRSKIRNLA